MQVLLISFPMSKFQKTVSVILLTAVLLLLVLLPKHIGELLDRPGWLDWLQPKQEPFRGIIEIWHVAAIRPYLGSLGNWLKKYAAVMEKKHFGVYLNVDSITPEEAEARFAEGERPDMISFPAGFMSPQELAQLELTDSDVTVDMAAGKVNGEIYAVPYCASCRLILFDPGKYTKEQFAIEDGHIGAETNGFESFKNGKCDYCIADVRQAGELSRLVAANKGRYFEVLPFETGTELVQFIGAESTAAKEKMPYILEFITLLTDQKTQQSLTELGLMPLAPDTELRYEQRFLTDAYTLIRNGQGVRITAFKNEKNGDEQ